MNPSLRIVLKWLLVLPVIGISLFATFMVMEFSILLDRLLLARISVVSIKLYPPLLLQPLHLLVMIGAALVLTIPSALVVGFALGARQKKCLQWGFSIAVLLAATFVWFVPHSASPSLSRWIAGTSAVIVIGGIAFAFFTSRRYRTHVIANALGVIILFVPSMSLLAHAEKYPPAAQRIWSVVLQKQTWQAMNTNTGSEYAATRQVVFSGDRVLAVFDSGSAGYEGKEPMSNYRLLSLDRTTGAEKDEIDFTGRWGSMPYIYATKDDHIDVQSNPPRVLNPDLSPANKSVAAPTREDLDHDTAISKTLGRCEYSPGILPRTQDWQGCSSIRIVDRDGRALAQRPVIDGSGNFAGASRDGSRFALVSNDSEGDPPFLLYEHFTIYDGHTATPVVMIPITDLPDRQSWSAFSPDGKYFVVGNPNNLSLYRLP